MGQFAWSVLIPAAAGGLLATLVLLYALSPNINRQGRGLAWGFTASRYIMTRGGTARDVYFDLDLPAMDPQFSLALADWYAQRVRDLERRKRIKIKRLAFLEKDSGPVGTLAMSSLVVSRTGIPGVILRVCRRIPMNALKERRPFQTGDRIVIVNDVATSGESVLTAVRMLRRSGGDVVALIVLVNRGGEAVSRRLEAEGVELIYGADIDRDDQLQQGELGRLFQEVTRTIAERDPSEERATPVGV